jgi:hypothetical protein
MIAQNKQNFDNFKVIHDNFIEDPEKYRAEFNENGRNIQDIVRVYENRLCSQSEGSGYGKFSTKLADKFQAEVKSMFPKFDHIGEE